MKIIPSSHTNIISIIKFQRKSHDVFDRDNIQFSKIIDRCMKVNEIRLAKSDLSNTETSTEYQNSGESLF